MTTTGSKIENYVHVVWATAERARLIDGDYDAWLAEEMVLEGAKAGCVILGVGCASDHVHVLLMLPPRRALADVMRRMKRGIARAWNRELSPNEPPLRWEKGYWAVSVSPRGIDVAMRFVVGQRTLHEQASVAVEDWEGDGARAWLV